MSNPRANKELGQHYLRDQKAIATICNDFIDQADIIVEVGPGPISLTKTLSQHEKDLYVIEKDRRFEELITSCVKPENIFFEDALKFNWGNFINKCNLKDKKIWLVSNLPYNVSVPLLMSFMRVPSIEFMTLMFQKEVGDKTYVRQGVKNQMSSLLTLCENYFTTKPLLKVAPGAFAPPPKVNSVVVSYRRRHSPDVPLEDFNKFESFLRSIFQFKRKQIRGILKTFLPAEVVQQMLDETQVAAEVRAEGLSYSQILALYKFQSNL